MRGIRVPVGSRTATLLLSVLVSAAVLVLLIARLDAGTSLARIASARPIWLVPAALLSFVVLLLRGLRFAAFTTRANRTQVTAAIAVQTFLNRVTPLRLGELGLPWLLHRHAGEDPAPVLVRLLLVRLVDLLVVLLAIVGAAFARGSESVGVALLLCVAIAALLASLRHLLGIAARLAGLVPHARVRALGGKLGKAAALRLSARSHAVLIATSLGNFAGQMALFSCLLRGFGITLPALELAQGGAVAQAGAALPVGALGSFGPLEATWAAGFSWVGVSTGDAILTGLAAQLITLLFAAAFALPAWLWLESPPRMRPTT